MAWLTGIMFPLKDPVLRKFILTTQVGTKVYSLLHMWSSPCREEPSQTQGPSW